MKRSIATKSRKQIKKLLGYKETDTFVAVRGVGLPRRFAGVAWTEQGRDGSR